MLCNARDADLKFAKNINFILSMSVSVVLPCGGRFRRGGGGGGGGGCKSGKGTWTQRLRP